MHVWHVAAFTHRGRVRGDNQDGVAIEGRILVGDMPAPTTTTILTCADAIRSANDYLYELMHADPSAVGMGTTLVGAALASTQLLIFNVGDSRGYLHSRDCLIQLSGDDVLDARIDRTGSRVCHAVTQAIGGSTFHVPVEPHISLEPPLLPGETLLLCSDGLTDMIPDSIIQDVLRAVTDIGIAARSLAAHAFRAGAADNISLMLAKRAA
jgi:protein phosphatase